LTNKKLSQNKTNAQDGFAWPFLCIIFFIGFMSALSALCGKVTSANLYDAVFLNSNGHTVLDIFEELFAEGVDNGHRYAVNPYIG